MDPDPKRQRVAAPKPSAPKPGAAKPTSKGYARSSLAGGPAAAAAAGPPPLQLPTAAMMAGCAWLMPGPKTKAALEPVLATQKRKRFIYRNDDRNLSHTSWGYGVRGLEHRWRGDTDRALLWSLGELIANILDVTSKIFPEPYQFHTNARTKALSIHRGDGEGFAGLAKTSDGLGLYNVAHPFCESALIKDSVDRPKSGDEGGTGSFNHGLKQAVQNLRAMGIFVVFDFWGYMAGEMTGGDELRAHYTYRWDWKRTKPYDLQFKQKSNAAKAPKDCDFPILFQKIAIAADQNTPAFREKLYRMAAAVFSTMERAYGYDETAGTVLSAKNGLSVGNRTCYAPLVEAVLGHPVVLPEGPLVVVGERFYQVNHDDGAQLPAAYVACIRSLVVRVPGKGVPGDRDSPFEVFADEQRKVTMDTFVWLLATLFIDICTAHNNGDALTERMRPVLAEQLSHPLLFGGESELFGAGRGKLISDILCSIKAEGHMYTFRRLLLRARLREKFSSMGDAEFDRRLLNDPVVHSGDPRRAAVLAYLLDTLPLRVVAQQVNTDVYTTTNMQAAEKRAALKIFESDALPDAPPDGLRAVADYVLGENTQLVCLPLPEAEHLRLATVPFHYHDDASDTHYAVMWQRDSAPALLKDLCELRVVGVQVQMWRADAIRDALKDPECADLTDLADLDALCQKVLELVRAVEPPNLTTKDDDDDPKPKTPEPEPTPPPSSPKPKTPTPTPAPIATPPTQPKPAPAPPAPPAPAPAPAPAPPVYVTKPVPVVRTRPGTKSTTPLPAKVNRYAGGKTVNKCPLADEPEELTHMNQVLVLIDGQKVYVPEYDGYEVGAELPVPDGFAEQYKLFHDARRTVTSHIGLLDSHCEASWSPDAQWRGFYDGVTQVSFINLASTNKTVGGFEGTILHELGHHVAGCDCGHLKPWYQAVQQLGANLSDAKKAHSARTGCPPCAAAADA